MQQTPEMSRQSKTDFLASYKEIDEDNLLEEPAIETRPQPEVSGQSTDKIPERSDLTDTFNLFRTYLESKLESFKEEKILIILLSLSREKCQ